ncbi:hypothetical protein FOA52_011173 [Chlamydomonas sp. UWO 241]|nr:hypothetical protein FOA52_011173 [Chlamydomonas sp. UWO 241]
MIDDGTLGMDVSAMSAEELKQGYANLVKAVGVLNQLAVSLDIHTALASVQKVALELLDCDRVTLFLVFEQLQELRTMGLDHTGEQPLCITVRFGEGIAGKVAQSGGSLNVPDAYTHPLFNPEVDRVTGYRTQNMLCTAIRDIQGRNVAVLQALNKANGHPFTAADERSLMLFGTHLGNTIAKARLHHRAERERHRISTLFNQFKLLSTARDLGQLLEMVTLSIRKVLHTEHAYVFLVDAPRFELWLQTTTPQGRPLSLRVKVGKGLVGACGVDRADPVNIVNYARDCIPPDDLLSLTLAPVLGGAPVRSVLAHPIFVNDESGKVAAVVLAINKSSDATQRNTIFFEDCFTAADCDAMSLLALEVGDALGARSLEIAYASALSVVSSQESGASRSQSGIGGLAALSGSGGGDNGVQASRGSVGAGSRREAAESSSAYQLRAQLMRMYFQGAMAGTRHSRMPASMSHWQLALTKLTERAINVQDGTQCGGELLQRSLSGSWAHPSSTSPRGGGSNRRSNRTDRTRLSSMGGMGMDRMGERSSAGGMVSSEHSSAGSSGAAGLPHGAAAGGARLGPFEQHTGVSETVSEGACVQHAAGGLEWAGPWSSDGIDVQPSDGGADRERQFSMELRCSSSNGAHDGIHIELPSDAGDDESYSRGDAGGAATLSVERMSPAPSLMRTKAHSLLSLCRNQAPPLAPVSPPLHQVRSTHSMSAVRIAAEQAGSAAAGAAAPHRPRRTGRAPAVSDSTGGGCGSDGESGSASGSRSRGVSPCFGSPTAGALMTNDDPPVGSLPAGGNHTAWRSWLTSMSPNHRTIAPQRNTMYFHGSEKLVSWNCTFVDASPEQMTRIVRDLFELSGVIQRFDLNRAFLSNLVSVVRSHYHTIPYHNFNHVVHATHGVFMLLQTPTAKRVLGMEEHLAVMIAALCHDLDHDGRSNSYHVHTQSELARLYNDISVMENHHCAMTFEVLRRKDCALLAHLDVPTQRRVRKAIIAAIQCTDMSNHFKMTQEFKQHAPEFDPTSEADRLMLGKVILHSVDIGNAVRPFHVNETMSQRVHKEFQVLAEEEERLGIPVTFSIDCEDEMICAQMELNFLDYIVTPLWERVHEVLQVDVAMNNLKANRERYAAVQARLGEAAPQEDEEGEELSLLADLAAGSCDP